jgi:hypothetical protein
MNREKLSDRQMIQKTVSAAGQKPCCICGQPAQSVFSFEPENPAAFGMNSGEALYVPACFSCLNRGIALDFLEQTLLSCGVRQRVTGQGESND